MSSASRIHEFLRERGVSYSVVAHQQAFTAQEEAAVTHVPGDKWAKVVVCIIDGKPVEAILPATRLINLRRLLDLAGGNEIRLAEEVELAALFPECERGAMPPLGPLYGHRVYADAALAFEDEIVFNAGTHSVAIAMQWADFARTIRPVVGSFAESAS